MDEQIKNFVSPFNKGDLISPDQAMQLAIEAAQLGAPYVSPNPLVGCVVVNDRHEFMAFGFHQKYGFDHAEIDALKKLSAEEIKNSTFYVTLEPCAHEGKTPSCAKALAKLPLKKVVYGLVDPNPLVQGEGARILIEAGIQAVEYDGPLKVKLLEVPEIFLKNFRDKKIFIAAKVASSLDGQIALKSGESKWITSEASRLVVHELRSYYDSILVGRQTIESDDPSLDVRHPEIIKETKVIVLDPLSNLLTSIDNGKKYKFLAKHKKENIYFAVNKTDSNFDFNQIEFNDLTSLTEKIYQFGIKSLFIEGGAKTYSSFIQANLVDRLYLFLAPSIIGNQNGISWTNSFGISSLHLKPRLKNAVVKAMGSDFLITGSFEK